MMILIILLAGGTMLVLALFMAYVLGWANETFHVEVDPRVEAVTEALPGVNCGACGYVGCSEYAAAVVSGEAPPNKCPVGGSACAAAIAAMLGVQLEDSFHRRAVVHCGAGFDDRLQRHEYRGEPTCVAANLVAGVQGCTFGCLGLGDCVGVCNYDAIHMVDGLAVVDYDQCIGCGACVRACPRRIISMVPFQVDRMLIVACSNKDFGKAVKAVCKVGCIGCKACTKVIDLFTVEANLARIDYDQYDPAEGEKLDAAVAKCPTKCIIYVGKTD